jgi:hypothetical protein
MSQVAKQRRLMTTENRDTTDPKCTGSTAPGPSKTDGLYPSSRYVMSPQFVKEEGHVCSRTMEAGGNEVHHMPAETALMTLGVPRPSPD